MSCFSLDSLLKPLYNKFPEADQRPVIAITANHHDIDATVRDYFHEQVIAAGGVPVIIPPVADAEVIANTLDHVDGVLFSGGADINPLWCGEEPLPGLHRINAKRDAAELMTARLAYNRNIPMLGICRGIQTLAIALGGHVQQDIAPRQLQVPHQLPPSGGEPVVSVKHSQDADRNEPTHTVEVEKGSILYNIYSSESKASTPLPRYGERVGERGCSLYVNSFHHQAVDNPGEKFRVTAKAKDGVIEAIESTEYKSILGVQWHPECLGEDGLPIFKWLVDKAKEYREAINLHSKIVVLDTHCDTPMFFHQGVDFTQRDERILVDLEKMTEGHQDATIMVAYLPQPKIGELFSSKVNLNWISQADKSDNLPPYGGGLGRGSISPMQYADSIFDKIEETVKRMPQYLSIARTPSDLYIDKRNGRKSIMLGIENGLALEHDIKNIQHFAQRGVVYITLCHNGDNDICDSAKGCNTHNGVSSFGAKVIKEMNRLGIMVDLSHAGEKSFYDALEISSQPIVCSHSNCRALCDHPRNLTDDQLRALALKGGVAHTTFYHGFLKSPGEADILDGIKHLEHAISIMGIDHVGIGTDFDGDGGVLGMQDSSDMMQFTIQLLRRRYSETDIRKIWGGNWLRVMNQVQAQA